VEDLEAVRCEFDHCGLGPFDSKAPALVVRNCRLERCRISMVDLRFVQFEDCVVDGVRGSMTITTSGPLFRHVTIRGSVDSLYIRPPGFGIHPDLRAIERHRAYYETVDWALDISQARLARCEMPGVPGRLVRRDPATQILVTRERVLATPWQEVAAGTLEYFGIEGLLRWGLDSIVEVACPRSKDFEARLASFARLREAGVAEPD
jgi:hypothetical protein